jgi:hypothetical protein
LPVLQASSRKLPAHGLELGHDLSDLSLSSSSLRRCATRDQLCAWLHAREDRRAAGCQSGYGAGSLADTKHVTQPALISAGRWLCLLTLRGPSSAGRRRGRRTQGQGACRLPGGSSDGLVSDKVFAVPVWELVNGVNKAHTAAESLVHLMSSARFCHSRSNRTNRISSSRYSISRFSGLHISGVP